MIDARSPVYPEPRKMGSPQPHSGEVAAPGFTPRPVGLWGSVVHQSSPIVPLLVKRHLSGDYDRNPLTWQTVWVESIGTQRDQGWGASRTDGAQRDLGVFPGNALKSVGLKFQ